MASGVNPDKLAVTVVHQELISRLQQIKYGCSSDVSSEERGIVSEWPFGTAVQANKLKE